nr:ABC transporter ATP-binding protein [Bacteroidales bacterium]
LSYATVFELVSYGRSPYTGFMGRLNANDEKVVDEAIQCCGIGHKTHHLFSSLSDGERQKVTIAKALAQDTPIIILDEPTAFLDLPSKVEIMQLLRTLSSTVGKSILMSTHDLDLALQMADNLGLIDAKNPLITGTPEELLLNNALQPLFENRGIVFDYKTGLFKVNYNITKTLRVQGHGFEFVMLRRAFSRNGVELKHDHEEGGHWIDIKKDDKLPFRCMNNKEIMLQTHSVEKVMSHYRNCKW